MNLSATINVDVSMHKKQKTVGFAASPGITYVMVMNFALHHLRLGWPKRYALLKCKYRKSNPVSPLNLVRVRMTGSGWQQFQLIRILIHKLARLALAWWLVVADQA